MIWEYGVLFLCVCIGIGILYYLVNLGEVARKIKRDI